MIDNPSRQNKRHFLTYNKNIQKLSAFQIFTNNESIIRYFRTMFFAFHGQDDK